MNVVTLSGGVGGAKLCLGFYHALPKEKLTIVANTADDFFHWGLPVSPDLDTVMYTLAGLNNEQQGWGLEGETWNCLESMDRLGGETWFQLGDSDIATHLQRKYLFDAGYTLTGITKELCQKLGVECSLLPMSDQKVSTFVDTGDGELSFQEYFVKHRCEPVVTGFRFENIENAEVPHEVHEAVHEADLIVICPSNPFVSIDPILSIPGMKDIMLKSNIPRVVISPIVSGMAIKGPAAKMMKELSMPVNVLEVARFYQDFATHIVLDSSDEKYLSQIKKLGLEAQATNTVMKTKADKVALARFILGVFDSI